MRKGTIGDGRDQSPGQSETDQSQSEENQNDGQSESHGQTQSAGDRGVPRDVLKSVEDGQRAAVDAVRRFIETVDRALPIRESRATHSRRQEIVDSAMEMAERLVQTQYDLLRKAVRSASRTFGDSGKRR